MTVFAPPATQELQLSKPGHAAGWENVWRKQRRGMRIIGMGRAVYNRMFLGMLMPYLHPRARFLEIGCGTASLGRLLSKHVGAYVGIDSSETALARAEALARPGRHPNMRFILRDMYESGGTGQHDIVWSQGLIEHFEDAPSVIERHLDACAKGGTAIISMPRTGSYLDSWYSVTRPAWLRRFWPWTNQRFFDEKDLAECMAKIDPSRYAKYHIRASKPRAAGIILLIIHR